MRISLSDQDIRFTLGGIQFQVLNFIYEKFLRTVHSHGSGGYEIHYISNGYGRARINGRFYDILPGTLYLTGPHVEHAQTPYPEDPMQEYCIYLKAEEKRRSSPSPCSVSDNSDMIFRMLGKKKSFLVWTGYPEHFSPFGGFVCRV